MIKISEAIDKKNDYVQCTSCLKSNDLTDIYQLTIGKNSNQTTSIKLCSNCIRLLYEELCDLV